MKVHTNTEPKLGVGIHDTGRAEGKNKEEKSPHPPPGNRVKAEIDTMSASSIIKTDDAAPSKNNGVDSSKLAMIVRILSVMIINCLLIFATGYCVNRCLGERPARPSGAAS